MKALVLAAAFLLTASVASAQHEHGRREHGERHERNERGERHERREHRGFDRDHHRRLRGEDIRFRGGRREIFFGGLWFGCEVWPEWVFVDDVYVVEVGDFYYVRSYVRPALMFQVNVVY